MKLTQVQDTSREPEVMAARLAEAPVSQVKFEGNGAQVGIVDDGQSLTVRIDPIGRDGAYRLDVHEIAANSIQVRVVVRGKGL